VVQHISVSLVTIKLHKFKVRKQINCQNAKESKDALSRGNIIQTVKRLLLGALFVEISNNLLLNFDRGRVDY